MQDKLDQENTLTPAENDDKANKYQLREKQMLKLLSAGITPEEAWKMVTGKDNIHKSTLYKYKHLYQKWLMTRKSTVKKSIQVIDKALDNEYGKDNAVKVAIKVQEAVLRPEKDDINDRSTTFINIDLREIRYGSSPITAPIEIESPEVPEK